MNASSVKSLLATQITDLEDRVRAYREVIRRTSNSLQKALEELKELDEDNKLLKEEAPTFGRFTGVKPWIAANRLLHETPGHKMKEPELVKRLKDEGAGTGKKMKGGAKAIIRKSLGKIYPSKRLIFDGEWVRLGPNAPEPGAENEKDE